MKYVLIILVLFLSLFSSCKEGEEVPETSPFIEINNKSFQFIRLASSQNFKVNTNIDDIKCKVTSSTDWCSAFYADADAELTITVASNNAYKSRTSNITLSGKDFSPALVKPTNTQNTITGMLMPPSEGINKKKATVSGLIYIMYYAPTGTEQPIKINIASGTVNGYFDSNKHTKEDWKKILKILHVC